MPLEASGILFSCKKFKKMNFDTKNENKKMLF
jgi:hypothetical protein